MIDESMLRRLPVISGATLAAVMAEAVRAHLEEDGDAPDGERFAQLAEDTGEAIGEMVHALHLSRAVLDTGTVGGDVDGKALEAALIVVAARACTWVEAIAARRAERGRHART